MLIARKFLVDARSFCKVEGLPIFAEDLEKEILRVSMNDPGGGVR